MTGSARRPLVAQLHDVLVSLLQGCGLSKRDTLALTAKGKLRLDELNLQLDELNKVQVSDLMLWLIAEAHDPMEPVIYLSAPITTGRDHVDGSLSKDAVVASNRRRAHRVAEQLRAVLPGMVIDPTCMEDVPGWEQPDYHSFWVEVIARYAREVIFVTGWEYSVGCATEFAEAVRLQLPTFTQDLTPLDVDTAIKLMEKAVEEYRNKRGAPVKLRRSLDAVKQSVTETRVKRILPVTYTPKDQRLARLAQHRNVAQFVSFSSGPTPQVRFSRIRGYAPDEQFRDARVAISALMGAAPAKSINIRSFRPGQDKGNPFEYGLTNVDQAVSLTRSLAADGYLTIVNETIDTADGGVSGVLFGGVIEFVPLDTPRGVEKPGVASLEAETGLELLRTVYGFRPAVEVESDERIEFSIHPVRVGYQHSHTLLWESERFAAVRLDATIFWPNRFSRFIGDKVYGLLIAHMLGVPVPATTVIARTVAPFQFGRPTGTAEIWLRTSPTEQQPGRFTTTYGWQDPYALLAKEDPGGTAIASVLAQEGVDPAYSGASLPGSKGDPDYFEGVAGSGDNFMLGQQPPEQLPPAVVNDVRDVIAQLRKVLGPVRLEFVHDGRQAWVVQLHLSRQRYRAGVISPGRPMNGWLDFDPRAGLESLNNMIDHAKAERKGIRVIAPVGLTSHVGDLLRKAGVPARLHLAQADS